MDTGNISTIARQMRGCCEQVSDLVQAEITSRHMGDSLTALFQTMLADEVKHLQQLVLELTKATVPEEQQPEGGESGEKPGNGDDSVFGPGDLDFIKEPKEPENPPE